MSSTVSGDSNDEGIDSGAVSSGRDFGVFGRVHVATPRECIAGVGGLGVVEMCRVRRVDSSTDLRDGLQRLFVSGGLFVYKERIDNDKEKTVVFDKGSGKGAGATRKTESDGRLQTRDGVCEARGVYRMSRSVEQVRSATFLALRSLLCGERGLSRRCVVVL